jgi:hypothetical protein
MVVLGRSRRVGPGGLLYMLGGSVLRVAVDPIADPDPQLLVELARLADHQASFASSHSFPSRISFLIQDGSPSRSRSTGPRSVGSSTGGILSRSAPMPIGISVDAARRKVKRGALAVEKRETPQGGTWWVRLASPCELPAAILHQAPSGAAPTIAPSLDLSQLVLLVERLQAQLLDRTEAATLWQARAEVLALQLDQARDRIRGLEAPRPRQGHEDQNLTAQAPEPANTAARAALGAYAGPHTSPELAGPGRG